ncbi:MAG: metallophosphoesterase [Undibacterium sp.]|nr:metallophosphoesterase [Opitutaceae bacterium]
MPLRSSPVSAEILPGLHLDSRRALWLPASRLLVVADLHWGYATTHRARGNLLPMWGDEELATALTALIADYQPASLLWLGDSLHALAGRAPAEAFIAASPVPITLIAGNHDARWRASTLTFLHLGPHFFHHGDSPPAIPAGALEIVGHHHPSFLWWDGAGTRLKVPALVAGPRRLILPAFSPWAAGTPWNARLAPDETLWAVTPKRVFAIAPIRPPSASIS